MAVRIWTKAATRQVRTSRIEREHSYPKVVGERRAYLNEHGDLVIDHNNNDNGRVVIAKEQARAFVDALHLICHACPDMAEAEIPQIVG